MRRVLLLGWIPWLGPLPPVLSEGGHCVGAEDGGLGMTGDARLGGPPSEGRWGMLRLAI